MEVVHALEPLPKAIFLAGPTPRSADVPSWRPEAIRILEGLGFEGKVYVPEPNGRDWAENYDDQIFWEWEAIHQSTVTIFWVPRHIETMPAFTTNVEFGLTVASSRILLGAPAGAPKMGYLRALASRYRVPMFDALDEMLASAVRMTDRPFG